MGFGRHGQYFRSVCWLWGISAGFVFIMQKTKRERDPDQVVGANLPGTYIIFCFLICRSRSRGVLKLEREFNHIYIYIFYFMVRPLFALRTVANYNSWVDLGLLVVGWPAGAPDYCHHVLSRSLAFATYPAMTMS
jgi:hypothetical protein